MNRRNFLTTVGSVASWVTSGVVVAGGGESYTRLMEVPWRVWPLGDSITLGRTIINGTGSDGVGGYRAKLPIKLSIKHQFVGTREDAWGRHDGWSGWRADQIAAQVGGWAVTVQPDVVLLHIGTNDLGGGATAEQINARIERIINDIRAVKRAWIFVAKLPPIPLNVGPREVQRQRFNDLLPGRCTAWGTKIFPVDQTDVAISTDQVHPSEPEGYEQEANHWAAQLNTLPHLLR